MKLKLALAASAAVLFAPALMAASAQEANVYVSGGYTQFDGRDGGANPGALTGRVGVGFGKYFAVEGEGSVGVAKDNGVKLDSELGVYGVGKLPVTENINLFARAGWSRIDTSPGGDEDGFAYGAGAEFNLTDKDGIRAGWTRHDYDVRDTDAWDVSYVRRF